MSFWEQMHLLNYDQSNDFKIFLKRKIFTIRSRTFSLVFILIISQQEELVSNNLMQSTSCKSFLNVAEISVKSSTSIPIISWKLCFAQIGYKGRKREKKKASDINPSKLSSQHFSSWKQKKRGKEKSNPHENGLVGKPRN